MFHTRHFAHTALLLPAPALAVQAEFVRLGTLPGGFSSRAFDVNANGTAVVGVSTVAPGSSRAFRWTEATGMVSLGVLPGAQNIGSEGRGISADGSVVVGAGLQNPAPFTVRQAFRWSAATGMIAIPGYPGSFGESVATATSAQGAVVVGKQGIQGTGEAFYWTAATGMTPLGHLPAGVYAVPNGVSTDGESVVGFDDKGPNGREAFRWTRHGGLQGLGDFAGGVDYSVANAVSDDGRVVVGYGYTANGPRAFHWTSGSGLQDLGVLPGTNGSFAMDVSGDGEVIAGVASDLTTGSSMAFLWTQASGMVDLRAMLIGMGVPGLSGFELTNATAVSNDGNAIAGVGRTATTQDEAWRVTLRAIGTTPIGSEFCAPAVTNSTGQSAVTSAQGSAFVGLADVTLVAVSLPPHQFGYFLNGRATGQTPNAGGSQGTLCLALPIGRYDATPLDSGTGGTFALTLDLTSTPTPTGSVGILAGETWHFQSWYRDVNPTATSNFTNAVTVVFR